MTRGCALCQRSPARRAVCCGQKLCDEHELKHPCPRAAELGRIASDPQLRKRWLSENAPEQALTAQVIAAVKALPEIEDAWQGKKRGTRESDLAPGLPDVIGFARCDARMVGVETKRNHKAGCICASCEAQRDFGERLGAAGGVYVKDVRTVRQAVDGVRLGLAMARGRDDDNAADRNARPSRLPERIAAVERNG